MDGSAHTCLAYGGGNSPIVCLIPSTWGLGVTQSNLAIASLCVTPNAPMWPGSAYPPDWDSSTEPLSAAQMDSVLEVVGTRLYASACSAATQAQIEASPAVGRCAGLAADICVGLCDP